LISSLALLTILFQLMLAGSLVPYWLNGGLVVGLNGSMSVVVHRGSCDGLFTCTVLQCNVAATKGVTWTASRFPGITDVSCSELYQLLGAWYSFNEFFSFRVTIFSGLVVILCLSVVMLCNWRGTRRNRINKGADFFLLVSTETAVLSWLVFGCQFFQLSGDWPPTHVLVVGLLLHATFVVVAALSEVRFILRINERSEQTSHAETRPAEKHAIDSK